MQRCSHSFSTASALRSIFFPTSNQTCVSTFLAPSYATDFSRTPSLYDADRSRSIYTVSSYASSRTFSSRAASSAPPRSQTRAPGRPPPDLRRFGNQQDRRPKDEEIKIDRIMLVGEKGTGPPAPASLRQVLRSIDREKQFLVQVGAEGGEKQRPRLDEEGNVIKEELAWIVPPTPMCKIMERKDYFMQEQNRGKGNTAPKRPKELEIGWNVNDYDLGYRLQRAEQFLADGRKVDIFLAAKKKQKPSSADEAHALIKQIRERLLGRVNIKEYKPMEGIPGRQVSMYLERKD